MHCMNNVVGMALLNRRIVTGFGTDTGESQSTYISLGAKHRLENPGTIPLEIIEVQSGGYLGEDDIVRFQDFYDRC